MELRLRELQKKQEELVVEMEKSISRRDVISIQSQVSHPPDVRFFSPGDSTPRFCLLKGSERGSKTPQGHSLAYATTPHQRVLKRGAERPYAVQMNGSIKPEPRHRPNEPHASPPGCYPSASHLALYIPSNPLIETLSRVLPQTRARYVPKGATLVMTSAVSGK